MKKQVAIYIRVSTQEQANEGFSIAAQKERLISYCNARDWLIYDVYIDPGFSGSNLDRPGIQSLLKNVGNFDTILVYKLDRLSRSQKDTLYLIEDVFLKNNVDFVSINESFDTSSPFGRAMIGILSVFAQLEREQIKERSLMGRIERAKAGLYHGGWNTPTGYRYIKDDDALVIDEYEAQQVKLIFNMYMNGKSMTEIRRHMHQTGYATKYGNYEHVKTVRNILGSAVYTGKIKFRDEYFDGQHEAIIDDETFAIVQKRLQKRSELSFKRRESRGLLVGSIWCGKCGARYHLKYNNGGYKYYTCYTRSGGHKRMVRADLCDNKIWHLHEIEPIVENEILKLSSSRESLNSLFDSEVNDSDNARQRKLLSGRISKIDRQISKLMDLYSLDSLPFESLTTKINALHLEKKSLEEEIRKYEIKQYSEIEISNAWNLLEGLEDKWTELEISEKRRILQSLVNRILINGEEITIEWSFL